MPVASMRLPEVPKADRESRCAAARQAERSLLEARRLAAQERLERKALRKESCAKAPRARARPWGRPSCANRHSATSMLCGVVRAQGLIL